MRIIFINNFYNHHQHALSLALSEKVSSFSFVETADVPQERLKLGWGQGERPGYVYHWQRDEERFQEELAQADVIILGSVPQKLLEECVRMDKVVLRYTERPLKKGLEPKKYIPRWIKWHMQFRSKYPVYLLCASAYTAGDYAKFGLFKNRAYKWGYFPETRVYEDPKTLISKKNKTEILWCGRFLDWKHPDDALQVAQRLKAAGYVFHMKFIGRGEMEESLRQMAAELEVEDCVTFCGSMRPEQVREHMEQAGIYLFTSDRQEGWGAVLNESMNSGCAVVASHMIGAAPYLIKQEENGLLYRSGDAEDLYDRVKSLLEHPEEQERMGLEAYRTITELWNAQTAADHLIKLAEAALEGRSMEDLIEAGPCSRAELISEKSQM